MLYGSFRKVQKIEILQRGQSVFFVKKIELFIMCVFLANQFRKISFLIFSIKRRPLARKKKFEKLQNIEFFQRGKSIVFVKKSNFLSSMFLWANQATKKSFSEILDKKRMLFRPENRSFQNLQPMEIFQRSQSMVLVKKSNFLSCVFSGQVKKEKIVLSYSK